MRLHFRNRGHANGYYKVCREILEAECSGPKDARLGLQQIRNAIYRGLGFNSFNEFEKFFVPEERIALWFHSKQQLMEAFHRAFDNAIKVANERGFEVSASAAALTMHAVNRVLARNEYALQRFIEVQRESKIRNERLADDATNQQAASEL